MKQTHKRKYIKMNEQTSAQIRIPTTTHNRKYKHNQTRNKQNKNMIQRHRKTVQQEYVHTIVSGEQVVHKEPEASK